MGNTEERSLPVETVTGYNVLDFRLLNPARPGITSFAVQIVKDKLERKITRQSKNNWWSTYNHDIYSQT